MKAFFNYLLSLNRAETGMYIIAIMSVPFVCCCMLPDFRPANCSNYDCEIGHILDVHFEYEKNGKSREKHLLIDTEKYRYDIRKYHIDFWPKLADSGNIGKPIKVYKRNFGTYPRKNPVSIEIDGKVIYSIGDGRFYEYLILLVAAFSLIMSVFVTWRKLSRKIKD